jgi:DNA-directed RNA polymerase subunit RPC12/RpoP
MVPFVREGSCQTCGRQYTVSGASINPGTETETPAGFRCPCGGWTSVFIPGSVNTEKLVVAPKEKADPARS